MKLHLVLKAKWFDMIKSGEKKEEYRDCSGYWIKRIWKNRNNIKSIAFHRGYTNVVHEMECLSIGMGIGNPQWGAPENEVIILKLGKEIN